MLFAGNNGFAIIPHGKMSAAHFESVLFSYLLRDSHSGNLRVCINTVWHNWQRYKHAVWHHLKLDAVGPSCNLLHHIGALGSRHMGQLCPGSHIPDGIYARLTCLKITVHSNLAVLHVQGNVFA